MAFQKRFVFLDGIRGIAALFVVTRHTGDFWRHYFFRSYLAVDLFFLLSGFVIALNYDERLRNGALSWQVFAKLRLIRLYPVYLFSVLLAVPATILGTVQNSTAMPYDAQMLMLVVCAMFFMPFPLPGNPSLFALNGPYWSLLFELLANFIYAFFRPILRIKALAFVIAIAGVVVCIEAFYVGKLDFGFQWGAFSIVGGLMRAVMGIFGGLLLFAWREHLPRSLENPYLPWFAIASVCVILASPSLGKWNWIADMIVVVFAFPAAVAILYKGKEGKLSSFLSALGAASYPIYVLHVPIGSLVEYVVGKEAIRAHASWTGIALIMALIAASILIERYLDIPLRNWLKTVSVRKTSKFALRTSLPTPPIDGQ